MSVFNVGDKVRVIHTVTRTVCHQVAIKCEHCGHVDTSKGENRTTTMEGSWNAVVTEVRQSSMPWMGRQHTEYLEDGIETIYHVQPSKPKEYTNEEWSQNIYPHTSLTATTKKEGK